MNKPLFVANWKMGVPLEHALKEVKEFVEHTTAQERSHVVVCPSFPAIASVRSAYSGVMVGAQDCSSELDGAFTGEVSAHDLRSLGCSHVIIGHSERRAHSKETDEEIGLKVARAVSVGLRPILCIGENRLERKSNNTFLVLRRQLEKGLKQVRSLKRVKLLIAYEPVWAIGAKKPASGEVIKEVHAEIVRWMRRWSIARNVSFGVLYGGAVDAQTVGSITRLLNVDGVLVGRASWSGVSCARLVHAML